MGVVFKLGLYCVCLLQIQQDHAVCLSAHPQGAEVGVAQ